MLLSALEQSFLVMHMSHLAVRLVANELVNKQFTEENICETLQQHEILQGRPAIMGNPAGPIRAKIERHCSI